jgi:1-acyl-sn-glycerol-3-phosphate acyltransferase
MLETFARYFRPDVRGFEHLPEKGPFLVVGNHSGGQMAPDLPILLTAWWRERGIEEPVYALFHSTFLAIPGIGTTMARAGGVEAARGNAEALLNSGAVVIVYPGGDHDVFRPWKDRNKIDFAGRSGFVRLALRTKVPIVPVVTCGLHESVFVLSRGERMAKVLRLDKLLRTKVWPTTLGLPFGVNPAGMPTLPMPAKATLQICEPIDWRDSHAPGDADDDEVVCDLYDQVVETMQSTLDRLAAERRFPIIG